MGSCVAVVRDNYPRLGARAAAQGRGNGPPEQHHRVLDAWAWGKQESTSVTPSAPTVRLSRPAEEGRTPQAARHLLISGELGVAKPDPDVCGVLAEQSGTRPADCLFLDDRHENIDSARRAGLRAAHWSGTDAGRTGRNPLPGVLGTVPVPSRRTPANP